MIDERVTEIIGFSANSFYLRELYLDGCEKINDQALVNLTKPRQGQEIEFSSQEVPLYIRDLCGSDDIYLYRKTNITL